MIDSTKTVSPLRQRMLDDMTMRKLGDKTQIGYVRAVKRFTRFFGQPPELASPEDLRCFQKHLVVEGVSATTINATITGLRFLFEVTLERLQALKRMSPVRVPHKLPVVLTSDEVARLLSAAPTLKAKAALSVAYGAGLRANEVVHLKISDIDSERMVLRVEQGKGGRDRNAMVERRQTARQDAAWWLVIPRHEPDQPDKHAPTQPHDQGRF